MRNILYILTAAFAGLILSQSCSLKDQYETTKNNYTGNGVEFIARPVGFNNQTVEAKSSADNLEKKVCNCYFLVFDSNGDRVYFSGGEAEYLRSFRVPKDVCSMGLLTACYLVNVPSTFAENIIGLTKPADAPATDNNKYINTAVIENLTYDYSLENGIPMGTPIIDGKSCIPMFGKAQFNPNNTTVCEISIKRLFAKVTINISLSLDLSSWGDELMQSSTYYKLNSYNLHNLPTKVYLEEKATESESDWAEDKSSFTYTDDASKASGTLSQSIVYNNNGNYVFSFYVPEYYLNPKEGADNIQQNKPKNYRIGETYPVNITLHGTYTEYTYRSASIKHYIYLGRDHHSDFSFARNIHYTNYLTIKGVDNSDTGSGDNLDWRVNTTVTHNPVEVEGKSANCYIIKNAGSYSFPAYKGAYNNLKNAEFCSGNENSNVELLASDNSKIQIDSLKYNKDNNFISFYVKNIDDGNVVIALKNGDGSTEWSWHLWCSTSSVIGDWFQNMTNITGSWGDLGFQAYPNGSKMMDRNLGASGSTNSGPYFKYGSKNPYISNDYCGGGTNGNLTWDPANDANTQDNTKAVNDPCPPGYRIPAVGSWDTGAGKTGTTSLGFIYNLANPNVTLYYNGYVYYDANEKKYKQDDDIENESDYLLENYSMEPLDLGNILPNYINEKGNYPSERTRTEVEQITEYYDFEYKAKTLINFNRFWYLDGQAYHYEYTSVDWSKILQNAFVITKCKTKKYKKYQDQKAGRWSITYSDVGDPYYGDYEYGEQTSGLDAYSLTIYNKVRGLNLSKSDSRVVETTDYGYQVRCIKDE